MSRLTKILEQIRSKGVLTSLYMPRIVKRPVSDMSSYSNAARNMLDNIKTSTYWRPSLSDPKKYNLSRRNAEEIKKLLGNAKETSSMGSAHPLTEMGDYFLEPNFLQYKGKNMITGSVGKGTPRIMLHELGHILNAQNKPNIGYNSMISSPMSALDAHSLSTITGGNVASLISGLGRSFSTLRNEAGASVEGLRALGNVKAPFKTRMDYLKTIVPSFGTYLPEAIAV